MYTREQSYKNIEEVKRLRLQGYTQTAIAKRLGIAQATVAKYLSGFVPTPYKFGRRFTKVTDTYRHARAEALRVLGNKCVRCGISDYRVLQVDHINGGGVKFAKLGQTGYTLYIDVVRNPSKYQCLCANCNWIKRYENKEWPQSKYD